MWARTAHEAVALQAPLTIKRITVCVLHTCWCGDGAVWSTAAAVERSYNALLRATNPPPHPYCHSTLSSSSCFKSK